MIDKREIIAMATIVAVASGCTLSAARHDIWRAAKYATKDIKNT